MDYKKIIYVILNTNFYNITSIILKYYYVNNRL